MYTNNQHKILGLAVLASIVTMGSPLVAQVSREEVREELQSTIESASARYRNRQSNAAYRSLQEEVMTNSKKRIEQLSKKKQELRSLVAAAKAEVIAQQRELENLRGKKMALESKAVDMREAVRALVLRDEIHATLSDTGPELLRSILHGAASESLRENALASMQRDALMEVRLQLAEKAEEAARNTDFEFLSLYEEAGKRAAKLENLQGQLAHAQQDYLDEVSRSENAQNGLLLSQTQLNQAKSDIAEIHRQVLQYQKQLARLDEQARRKSERSLIELGILGTKTGEYSTDQTVPQEVKVGFSWPVRGRTTAGFREASYYRYFGIPHNGIDIAVAQGTAVRSAADGVVFVVREGGRTGYTYVLVGHAAGYATLYGHLSAVVVAPGQTVRVGQVLGLSGGEPGTEGAGPTTTGQHLHFEVIQGGVNVNPMSVLP